jgi:hypothetical protein
LIRFGEAPANIEGPGVVLGIRTFYMTEPFEQVTNGIVVHAPNGDTQNIPTPKGYDTRVFKGVLAAFNTAYMRDGKNPDVNTIHAIWPRTTKKNISGILGTLEFKNALQHRGISFDPADGLSMEQHTVLLKLADPFDRRGLTSKLKDLNVPVARFQAWMKQPLFFELFNKQTRDNYVEALPVIRQRLIGNAEAGDQKAIELVFAMTGEWNPAQQNLDDAKTIILKIVEAIIRHVKDASVREAILADVSMYAGTLSAVGSQKTLEQ